MKKNTSTSVAVKAASNPSPTTPEKLTDEEYKQLQSLEEEVQNNIQGGFRLAAALAEIRDKRLYREDYKSFKQYCKSRWDYSVSYCHRLCETNSVMTDLKEYEETDIYPHNESQARVFVNLDKAERIKSAESLREEKEADILTASIRAQYKKKLFPDKCAAKPAKKQKPIDVESTVTQIPESPSLIKLVEAAKEMLHNLENKRDKELFASQLRTFIKEAKPNVEWEKQHKAKHN